MAVTDPVDARLLAAVAELGKAAVHEVAAKVGMDPRDVAYRLVNLSAGGLPLLVGVESDPNGLRAALSSTGQWGQSPAAPPPQPSQPPPPPQQGQHGQHGQHGQQAPQPPRPPQPPQPPPGPPAGQSGQAGPYPAPGTPSGAYPVPGAQSGAYPVRGTPSGGYPAPPGAHGMPSGQYPPPQPAPQAHPPQRPAPPPQQAPPPQSPPQPAAPLDPVMTTWGPPQSALWARGDQPPGTTMATTAPPAPNAANATRTGRPGDVLATEGLEGEQLAIQLLEVQDPADFLFGAAGYELADGERAVVVHTEITNRGGVPFASLPDNYLELLTEDGKPVGKAPVSLTSRPPHKIGVQPGETTGGHTVYVLPEATRVASVRWSPRPEPDERTLTWSLDD